MNTAMNPKYLLLLILTVLGNAVYAQGEEHHEEHHEGNHDHYEHHRNEIGIANAPVYFVNEGAVSYGLHIHFLTNIAKTKFSLGLGYERIFDEHQHNTIGLVGSYRPTDRLSFNLSPGITFEGEEASEGSFALHAETAYEFEFKNIHFGPVLELAYDLEDYHLSLGLHLGYGF
ncbi:MAG TPA: hypothetical protein EYN89_07625 [Flavobacteriales bacterium]|nr:hypothetical protein [Flavobacteriales bacterium]